VSDPFDTAGIRRRVLDAWDASPGRFREDANAEEDLVLGGYRDRLLVELAQNAADAAAEAGVPGVLRLRLVDGCLRAANTGAPLDAAGVAALASLRASAKRDTGAVGRFGVGFAAVLAVTEEPEICSRNGGVRFSAAETRQEVAGLPALTAELARRGGAVPVLRLPRPLHDQPPEGFSTEVRLPVRPAAVRLVQAALDSLDASLLLALPLLSTVDVNGRLITRNGKEPHIVTSDAGVETSWHVVRAEGTLPDELLADRPTEERERAQWAVLWAVPETGLSGRQVIYAPTPSDEPLSLPARLVATFPLGADRRHVAPGPLTDWLVERCADAYLDLVRIVDGGPEVLRLVPQPGLAAGQLDAALSTAILVRLRATRWLPGGRLPAAARVLDFGLERAVPLLHDVIPSLLPVDWAGRVTGRPLQALGVRRLPVAEVVDAVASIVRPPVWWRDLYAALADAPDREALGALPVPLVDGRLVTGPRGVLLPGPDLSALDLTALDVRLVHPEAVHPLLERLGGIPATARSVLADDRVRAQVEQAFDSAGDDDAAPLVDAVLALVAATGIEPGELPWLAELPLLGEDGETYPAGELLLPGSPLAAVIADDAPFGTVDAAVVGHWGADVLEAAGVLSTFGVLHVPDVDMADHDLDGEQDYLDDVLAEQGSMLEELVAVRDLEMVDPGSWPSALAMLGAPASRSVVATDAVVVPGGATVSSYTRWWLSRHRVLDGRRPRDVRMPDASDLCGMYDEASGEDAEMLRMLGCRTGLDDVLADLDGALDLLDRLSDPKRTCPASTLRRAYTRLAEMLVDVEPPALVRVEPALVVPAEQAVVLDAPYALPLLGDRRPVPGGPAVAGLLDLPLASELVTGLAEGPVVRTTEWREIPGVALAADRLVATIPETRVLVHDGLTVSGTLVTWWPAAGTDHVAAAAGAAALGRALAWRLGRWNLRAAAIEALAGDGAAAYERELRAEDAAG